jgi:hypothetical protein
MTDVLVEVRMLGLPIPLWNRWRQHQDERIRELTLITLEPDARAAGDRVPARLLELVDRLRDEFAVFTLEQTEGLEAALVAGDESIDVTCRVPASARDAGLQLDAMLDEVEHYCREGRLLALQAPPECVEFRRWFLGEFVRQIDGTAPTPWSERTRRRNAGQATG